MKMGCDGMCVMSLHYISPLNVATIRIQLWLDFLRWYVNFAAGLIQWCSGVRVDRGWAFLLAPGMG